VSENIQPASEETK